jgi:hypothetical protein
VAGLLEAGLKRHIAQTCPLGATIDPTAPLRADLDGDGINDIVMDERALLCTGQPLSENCGAVLCSVAVYLSRVYPQKGTAEYFLGVGAHLVRGTDGRVWIGTGGRLPDCPKAYDPASCTFYWRFDGASLSPVPRP